MKFLLREPLVHFAILGLLLFLLFERIGAREQAPTEIVVSQATIESLAHGFQGVWDRAPTEAELDELIEEYTKEEIYYRAAIAAGLDRDDSIVRRRLRQKMEFLAAEPLERTEPTAVELEAFIAQNAEWYGPREGVSPAPDDVRRRAARDWLSERRRRASDAFYERLRQEYSVRIERATNRRLQSEPEG